MIKNLTLLLLNVFDFFYKKKIIRFLKKNDLINIDIFFDIGAHKGESINFFLKEIKVKKIISFEASPINFEFLKKKKNYYVKKFPNINIKIENIALGSENKNILFKQFDESSSSTFSRINKQSKYFKRKYNILNFLSKEEIFKSFNLKIQTLDNYMEINNLKKIDFIKIDTEGFENNVLEGGIKLLKKHKPKFIQLEFNWHQLIKNQTLRNLSKLIYFSDVYRILPNNYGIIKIDPSRPENNIYHLSNYIFINKNISKKFK